MRRVILTALLIAFLPALALADAPPLPQRKTSLETIQKNLQQKRATQATLERKLNEVKKELESTRDQLVRTAEKVQANEENLERLGRKIAALRKEKHELTAKLEKDYGSIADLILALERMRRIPPESLIVRPGAPLQTAQSAMLLQGALPAINHRAEKLSSQLARLGEIGRTLQTDRAAVIETKDALEKRQKEIRSLVDKRERLFGEIQTDYGDTQKSIARLSKEAQSLHELISKLEEEEKRKQAAADTEKTASLYKQKMPDPGTSRLPVTGYITVGFGATDAIGAASQGIKIEARPGSLVTAPMGGIIRFAGTFKNYGNMVIIEHKNGFHSLIAGFSRIDAAVGSRIKSGEPLGQLPLTSSRGGRPALYYELRQNGHPVDPAERFSELKS